MLLLHHGRTKRLTWTHPGSNWRPCACEAHVITNYTMSPQHLAVRSSTRQPPTIHGNPQNKALLLALITALTGMALREVISK